MIWGVNPCRVDRLWLSSECLGWLWVYPASYSMVTWGSVLGGGVVGAAGTWSYPLPPPSVRVKNEWSHTSPSQLPIHWVLGVLFLRVKQPGCVVNHF